MKKYLIHAIMLMAFCSCKHKASIEEKALMLDLVTPKPNVEAIRFSPPIVKPAEKNANVDLKDKADDNDAPQASTIIKDTSKKIIKQGDIRFEAKDIAATRKALLYRLNKLGGYADEDNQSLSSDSGRKEYNIKARIPARNFDAFVDIISSGAARIDYKHISVSDVTTEYIDMKTRINNQKILEATYIGLLKKASRMKDILDIEDKITDTRTEIESQQGQLNYMSKQIAYSTLDITFYTQSITAETGTGAGYKFSTAFSEGWAILQALFYGIITLWPLDLLAIGIFIMARNWRKRRKTAVTEQ